LTCAFAAHHAGAIRSTGSGLIRKDFIIAKDFCTYSIRILRQEKSFTIMGRVVVAYTSSAVLKVRNPRR
jgi:hypothetical protein